MFNDRFTYILHINKSKIKQISPIIKIISLIIFLISLIFTTNIFILLLLFIFSLFLLYKTNIEKNINSNMLYFLLVFSILFLINLLSRSLYIYLIILFKGIIGFTYLSYFVFTTSLKELYFGLSKLLKPFNKLKINSEKISIGIVKLIYIFNILIIEHNNLNYNLKLKINDNLKLSNKVYLLKIYIKNIFIKTKDKYKIVSDYLIINSYKFNKLQEKNNYNLFLNIMFLLFHVIIIIIVITCEVYV